jgi:DNA polymerase V
MSVLGLIDANNFFCGVAACYDLSLRNVPVVTVGSNDGMAISRNAMAKELGIKMAQPYFQFKQFEQSHGLIVKSANFELITDMSQRVRDVLDELVPEIFPYSVDESFFICGGLENKDLEAYAQDIRKKVLQWTGVASCIGLGANRTLAKLSNYAAKKYKACNGVVDLYSDSSRRERLLKLTSVGSVWGVGPASAKKLIQAGIETAFDLADYGSTKVHKEFGVMLARTATELRGEVVFPFEDDAVTSQSIIASRSLGGAVKDPETLFASIATHIARGARKLRLQNTVAGRLSVSIQTSAFNTTAPRYSNKKVCSLPTPTSDTAVLTRFARDIFEQIFRSGYDYSKTAIEFTNVIPVGEVQDDLFSEPVRGISKSTELMGAIDSINAKYGMGVVTGASEKQGGSWRPKSKNRSPCYTTQWAEIPIVKTNIEQ